MSNPIYLYSGKCRMGTVGQPTKFNDAFGNSLFVGDIVCIVNDDGYFGGMTAVVSDEFTTYQGGIHKVKEGPIEPFVMGIKSVDLNGPNNWNVIRLKSHQDVIDGEHWKDYGFNYSCT